MKEHLKELLLAAPAESEKIISIFVLGSEAAFQVFDDTSYDVITKLVDASVLIQALNSAGLLDTNRTDDVGRAAHEFVAAHSRKQTVAH